MFERITLENFGVFARLDLRPAAGLNGVVGRNGAGKSTLLAAMELLVTGVVPTAGVKELNISHGAAATARSAVSGTLVHGGRRLEIVRGLRRAKTTLAIDGAAAIEGDARVGAALAEVFGASMPLLADYVFVKQGEIHTFLDATPAVRARALAQLFGTTRAEACRDLLGKALATIRVPAVAGPLDALRRRLGDDEARLDALRAARAEYADLKGYDRAADLNAVVVARREARDRARAARDAAENALIAYTGGVEAAEAVVADREARHGRAAAASARAAAAATAARVALATWKAHRRRQGVLADLESRYASLAADAAAHPRPSPHDGYLATGDEVRRTLLEEVRRNIANDADFLAVFDATGVAACPTCGTPAAALAAKVEATRAALAGRRDRLRKLEAKFVQDRAFEAATEAWERWRSGYRDRVAWYNRDVAAQGDDADDEPPPAESEDELHAVIAHAVRAADDLRAAAADLARAASTRDELRGRRAAAEAALAAAAAEADANAVDDGDAAAAEARLAATLVRIQDRGRILGEIAAVKASRLETRDAIAALEAEAAEADRLGRLAGRLEAARAVLHHANLPRRVARGYMALVEGGVNRLLDRFGADFRVAAGDDLALAAHFHAGPAAGAVQPACRLSGGQKVMLAIAFRVEVNALFAADLGLICLDEPTQWLDDRAVGCLRPALAALKALAADRALQCFLVTHDRGLAALCDDAVVLGGGEEEDGDG